MERRTTYQPALDGIRALAVLAVLLFHAGVPGLGGGYVGVSVFFTLSGFLITTLLIQEHRTSGRIDAPAFYSRRARRLLPASTLCLAAVAILAAAGAWDQVPHLRRDVAGAALQVFNWVRLTGGTSYADLFSKTGGQASPLEHYWSLAIEEQFYWLWPVTFVGLAAVARRTGRSLTTVVLVPAVAFVALAPVIARVWGPDAAYWATPARIGEILTGAVAAAVLAERGSPRWTARVAPLCLAAIAVACAAFPTARGPAYQGWLPALSLVTAVLLLGLQHPGPVRTGLSWRPLVALGTISYGVYLYHWPLYTLLDQPRVGFGGAGLLAVRLAATLAAAVASHLILERPIRLAHLAPRPTLLGAVGLTVAVLALVAVIPVAGPAYDAGGDAAAAAAIDPAGPTTPLGSGASGSAADGFHRLRLTAPEPPRPVRILVIGDSTANAIGSGLVRWAAANPSIAQVTIQAASGCGFVQGGVRVFPEGDQQIGPLCRGYARHQVADVVRTLRPDVVVAVTTTWDVIDQRFPGTGTEAPTDPEYRRRIGTDLGAITRSALDAGAGHVLWILEPPGDPYWNPAHSPQEEPERHAVLHQAMQRLARRSPDQVAVADLAWWIDRSGLATDHPTRPDGIHLSPEASERLATRWLGPAAVSVAMGA